jgi:hypothetical protein
MDTRRRTTRPPGHTRRALGVLALAGAALLGGCLHDPTEIVVVVDTDLKLGIEFDTIQFMLFGNAPAGIPIAQSTTLPATLGVVPQASGAQQFDVMAVASQGFDTSGMSKPVVQRRVSNIRFVPNEIRSVFIPLLRQCMCQGTNCDTNPPCNDIVTPTLAAFDENNIPHL